MWRLALKVTTGKKSLFAYFTFMLFSINVIQIYPVVYCDKSRSYCPQHFPCNFSFIDHYSLLNYISLVDPKQWATIDNVAGMSNLLCHVTTNHEVAEPANLAAGWPGSSQDGTRLVAPSLFPPLNMLQCPGHPPEQWPCGAHQVWQEDYYRCKVIANFC